MQATETKSPLAETIAFLEAPPLKYANTQEAIAFVLTKMLEQPRYSYELLQLIESECGMKLSDTILIQVMGYLQDAGIIYQLDVAKTGGRGRPRKVFAIVDQYRAEALKIAALWTTYLGGRHV